MTEKTEAIYAEALALNKNEREALVRLLAPHGKDWIDPEIEKAWLDEITRREKEYAEGKIESIPAEEVFRELRKKYG
ncbi:MAG: addiction module protein [Gammaproteobacteria bacterium]|jgi:putative addiction module component (TIGR02574 family)|nr:addiction module antitoxin RelB [Chromatiales bacterium]MDP6674785.1 addiction module protein [Gammaproteobacteria bacterium]